MIDLLDAVLKAVLDDRSMAPALQTLLDADVSFITPDRHYVPDDETINLFLYGTKENRELRDPVPIVETRNGVSVRKKPPLRVDCSYMVTAWSKKAKGDKVAAEHHLLGQAFNWLSRFPTVPDKYLRLVPPPVPPLDPYLLPGQVFPPPTMVAQMDGAKNTVDFWTALGIAPRPHFNVIVTIAMDLSQEVEGPMVTTISSHYHASDPAGEEEPIIIGGTVRDASSHPVRDAWVRLEPAGLTQITDDLGHFVFGSIARGSGMTLRARANGHPEITRANVDVPSLTGEYDMQFT